MGVAGMGRGMQLCGVGGGDGGRRWRGGEVAAFRLRTHGVDYGGRTAGTARRLRLLPSPWPAAAGTAWRPTEQPRLPQADPGCALGHRARPQRPVHSLELPVRRSTRRRWCSLAPSAPSSEALWGDAGGRRARGTRGMRWPCLAWGLASSQSDGGLPPPHRTCRQIFVPRLRRTARRNFILAPTCGLAAWH